MEMGFPTEKTDPRCLQHPTLEEKDKARRCITTRTERSGRKSFGKMAKRFQKRASETSQLTFPYVSISVAVLSPNRGRAISGTPIQLMIIPRLGGECSHRQQQAISHNGIIHGQDFFDINEL